MFSFGDAVAAIACQQSSRFKAGHCPGAAACAVGVTSNTAVALDQVAHSQKSPVGWVNVRKLSDAGDLRRGCSMKRWRRSHDTPLMFSSEGV